VEFRQDIAELSVSAPRGPEMPTGPSKQQSLPLHTSDPVSRSRPTSAWPNSRDPSAHQKEATPCAMCGNIHQGTCGMTEHSENLVQYRQILLTNQTGESFEERRDAIAIIDSTLEKRGQLHLVYNQPLRLVEKRKSKPSVSVEGAKPRTQKVPPTQLPSSRPKTSSGPQVLPRVGILNGNVPSSHVSAKDRPLEIRAPEPTSLKRLSDASSSTRKKQRTASYPGCPVCGGPHHLVKDCPVTAAGPKSIYEAILRLESQSGQSATVAALREVLKKYEKHALRPTYSNGIQR